MCYRKILGICFILFHTIIAIPQINLYYTDFIDPNENEINKTQQYHCLRVINRFQNEVKDHEVIFYCLTESPSIFDVTNNISFPKYYFNELVKKNITSYDLYL